jgi:hypothetical protein
MAPWRKAPYSLVSWWDMEKFSAELFLMIGKYLADARARAKALGSPDTKLTEGLKPGSSGHAIMMGIRGLCQRIGLRVSCKSVDYLVEGGKGREETVATLIEDISQLERTIRWESEDKLFMYIPSPRAERYELSEPFGPNVAKNFPSCDFDARESGNCFASGRFTASVFHLMRVLEIGLISFAKLFPAVPTNKENWQQIIEKIESEIRKMPDAPDKSTDWKEKQEKYSQLAK